MVAIHAARASAVSGASSFNCYGHYGTSNLHAETQVGQIISLKNYLVYIHIFLLLRKMLQNTY